MKQKRKLSLLLALALGLTPVLTSINQSKSYAKELEKKDEIEIEKRYKKIVNIEYNGKKYDVEVFSDTPFIQTRSFSPEYPVGTIKNLSFRISREMLELGSRAAEISIRALSKVVAHLLSQKLLQEPDIYL